MEQRPLQEDYINMKLLFLGSGASGLARIPEAELKEGDRRAPSMLIDDNVLVDVSLRSFDYMVKIGKDPSKITDIFLSHAHFDHFNRDTLMKFVSAAKSKIRFWYHRGAQENMRLSDEDISLIELHPLNVCDSVETGGICAVALPANHLVGGLTSAETPLHYIFEKEGKRVFYGCDGGWYTTVEWEYLLRNKVTLDAVVMDATVGADAGNFRIGTHNTLAMVKLLVLALKQNGIIEERTPVIATHFSRSCYPKNCSHDDVFAPLGVLAAADGREFEI